MSQIYSSCTVCYKELSELDKKLNSDEENLYFPICNECLEKSVEDINEELKK